MRSSQFACSTLEVPKYTLSILSLPVVQVILIGPVNLPAAEPIHKPSVFCVETRAGAPLKSINKIKTSRYRVIIGKDKRGVVRVLRDLALFIVCAPGL